jgi:hypothetical protein
MTVDVTIGVDRSERKLIGSYANDIAIAFVQVTQGKRPPSAGPVIGIPDLKAVSLACGKSGID